MNFEEDFELEPLHNVQWCLGIDNLEFEYGSLAAYFYTEVQNQTDEELKRFVLALSEFVKDYR